MLIYFKISFVQGIEISLKKTRENDQKEREKDYKIERDRKKVGKNERQKERGKERKIKRKGKERKIKKKKGRERKK